MIDFDQVQDDVVQQAGEDRFFLLALFQRVGRALQDVSRRGEPELEEIDERRFVRHRLERLQRGRSTATRTAAAEDRPCAAPDHRLRGRGEPRCFAADCRVERIHHMMLERVGQRLGRHRLDRRRSAQGREENSPIDLHARLR